MLWFPYKSRSYTTHKKGFYLLSNGEYNILEYLKFLHYTIQILLPNRGTQEKPYKQVY